MNKYDRIIKENLRYSALPIINKTLNIKPVKVETMPHKIEYTTEREADYILKLQKANKQKQILHLEFQVKNDPNMLKKTVFF